MNEPLFSIFLFSIPMFAVTIHYIVVKKKEGQKYDKPLVFIPLVVFSSLILWGIIVIIMAIARSVDTWAAEPSNPLIILSVFLIILNIVSLITKWNQSDKYKNNIFRFQRKTFIIFSIMIIIWAVISAIV